MVFRVEHHTDGLHCKLISRKSNESIRFRAIMHRIPSIAKICKTAAADRAGPELAAARVIETGVGRRSAQQAPIGSTVFLLHSLTVRRAEIPQRFSSSSLPPSFAAGRCATACMQPQGGQNARLAGAAVGG
ncbi:hypothetical protein [Piscinibacter sakaiensis]|uniref:hypothetical protein n=1 Tax=Piscinibacter sakaiensis TaxID=1547922 RepID=UPI003AACF094